MKSWLYLLLLCGNLSAAVLPPSLNKGDTIAIVAPGSSPEEEASFIAAGVKDLTSKGYKVKVSSNLKTKWGYLAGTDYDRAKAFMDAWRDPEVKMVWCYRGGFGCTRILDRLDYEVIKENPKILVGMSDITALHAAIYKETGLVTYLGPNFCNVYGREEIRGSSFNEKELWKLITSKPENYKYVNPSSFPLKSDISWTIRHGKAKGELVGGNLSLVAALVGTPWQIDTAGKILVLEEIDEEPYRIDRMLQQLKHAGLFDKPAGVILCSWRGCRSKKPDKSLTLERIFMDYFSNAPYPVFVGFPSGHITDQVTLPLHVMAEINTEQKSLRLISDLNSEKR